MVLFMATRFFGIELGVGVGENLFDAFAVAVVYGNADTCGKLWPSRYAVQAVPREKA